MLIYAVCESAKTAITVGLTEWFKTNSELLDRMDTDGDKVLTFCGPACTELRKAYNSYLEELRSLGSIRVMLDFKIPETITKKKGFWEYQIYRPLKSLGTAGERPSKRRRRK